jgi:hypothetical protein
VLLYSTGCSEAILTYVPQDVDGVIHAHMWIGGAQYCEGDNLEPSCRVFHGFPGCRFSSFPDMYTVVFYECQSVLPPNRAIAACHGDPDVVQWLGNVLVIKHVGCHTYAYCDMGYEDKALVDAILSRYVHQYCHA